METTTSDIASLTFDTDGFLTDPTKWNRDLAQQLAAEDKLGILGDEHWAIIQQLRDHYLEHGALLPTSHACRVSKLDPQCVTGLFHGMREAWRISGLPNPGEEAKSYM